MESLARVYLDVSALGRQFDVQSQERIRLETEAMRLILEMVAGGDAVMAVTLPLLNEVSANPNPNARQQILDTMLAYGSFLGGDEVEIAERTTELISSGNTMVDALHVAIAEFHEYDFVSCDDRLLKRLARQSTRIWSGTPIAYCTYRGLT